MADVPAAVVQVLLCSILHKAMVMCVSCSQCENIAVNYASLTGSAHDVRWQT